MTDTAPAPLARVKFLGKTIVAEPRSQFDNGDWLMIAKEHGPRFAVGSPIRIKPGEIVEMAESVTPPADTGANALQKELADERATLKPVAELLTDAKKDRQNAKA